jgi:hypothetical protein
LQTSTRKEVQTKQKGSTPPNVIEFRLAIPQNKPKSNPWETTTAGFIYFFIIQQRNVGCPQVQQFRSEQQ